MELNFLITRCRSNKIYEEPICYRFTLLLLPIESSGFQIWKLTLNLQMKIDQVFEFKFLTNKNKLVPFLFQSNTPK